MVIKVIEGNKKTAPDNRHEVVQLVKEELQREMNQESTGVTGWEDPEQTTKWVEGLIIYNLPGSQEVDTRINESSETCDKYLTTKGSVWREWTGMNG